MKKSVSTSLALVALALTAAGGIALLGGPNVLTVLSNIKPPSKPKIDKPTVEEKEEVSEDKQEEIDQNGKEIALEAKAQVEQPTPKKEEVKKEPKARVETAPEPEPKIEHLKPEQKTQKPTFTAPNILVNATQKEWLVGGKYALVFPRGERVEYNEHGIPVWSSWEGRLIDTQEERDWLNKRGSSGSEGKGFWCLTPREVYVANSNDECYGDSRWQKYPQ